MGLGNISFNNDAREDILDLYDKTIDEDGFIVENENKDQRVLTKKGEEVHIDEWAGLVYGSVEFVKSDAFSLIELAKKLE